MIRLNEYKDLLKSHKIWVAEQGTQNIRSISGKPQTDSRAILPGDVFICIKGLERDGHEFIGKSLESGVSLIIQETEFSEEYPGIRVTDSRKAAALLAKLYYDNPTGKVQLIGVTGTNGKTTTSMLIWQALRNLGHKVGWIGTLGFCIDDKITPTQNTTPDIMELNSIFDGMVKVGCRFIVMEVSSHALALDRVFGLEFDTAIFTNLSREHLDFHTDMDDYFASKFKLFTYLTSNNGTAIINIDDEYGRKIRDYLMQNHYDKIVQVSFGRGDVEIKDAKYRVNESNFKLSFYGKILPIKSNLTGQFNVMNLTMALISVKSVLPDISYDELKKGAAGLLPVKGRMELVLNNKGIGVYVDYAHTPDAIKSVLSTLQKLPHKRIITVFGAGGNRDKGKRSEMLQMALQGSDTVILTDDNPRRENPNQIIKDIVEKTSLWAPWWIIRNRKAAIEASLKLAQPGDIVLIAGKGHENYQEINGTRYHFDDYEAAAEFMKTEINGDENELILPVDAALLEILLKNTFNNDNTNPIEYYNISTDSRSIRGKTLFIALKGEKNNGMDYVQTVLKDDSCGAIINEEQLTLTKTIFFENTFSALGMIAKKYLTMFPSMKIALTGSTGKTTTKEYLANIFSCQGNTIKTYANENNIIGLCKTIFRIKPETNYAIFELGTNHFGEIAELADICNPNIGIITNIGPSHLEFLKNEEGVYREKTALFHRNLTIRLYPGDDQRFSEFKETGLSVGYSSGCKYRISDVITNIESMEFELNHKKWTVMQTVPFFITNIAYAIACAEAAGVSEECIRQGLKQPVNQKMRMEIKQMNNRMFIIDCYNANPISMKSAIQFWQSFNKDKPHVAILGDMLELGEKAVEYHKNIGLMLETFNYDLLITVGELSRYYLPESAIGTGHSEKNIHYINVDELLSENIGKVLPENSVVLVKASHSMNLEKLLDSV